MRDAGAFTRVAGPTTSALTFHYSCGQADEAGELGSVFRVPPQFRPMLRHGILNPQLLSLVARVRHTNALVIADRGFPSWPGLETIDLSLVDGVPTVLQVLAAIRGNFII